MAQKRIFILYPPISKQERYSSQIGNAGGEQIPLGLYYLASYLQQFSFDVMVLDAEAKKLSSDQIISSIQSYAPDFIGISSTTVAFHRAIEIAELIKESFKSIPIILGGPHVSSNVEHAMKFECFDFAVIGEGEKTLKELLDALDAKKNLESVAGIAFHEQGALRKTAPRAFIDNLDELPMPAYNLIDDLSLYTPPPSNYLELPVINMITSRGCPSQCTFCDRNVFGSKYRERSAENVCEEIIHLHKKYGIREISFADDTFLINKKRIYRLFALLDQAKISLNWTCMSRINNVDFDFLKFLKNNGCWHISFGIESGDEEILKVIKKRITLDKAREIIQWCRQLKIKTKGFFIIGHPTETLETINKTIRIACDLDLDDIVATINTPIPGSQQYSEAAQYGNLDTTDWSQFNYWRPVFVPKGLSKDILLKKHQEMYRKFYLRPKILFRYALSFFGRDGIKRLKTIIKSSQFLFAKNQ
jgi:anaerobic magnesium-protoporphyrin IX monomethyl ester cyclase